MNPMDDCGTSPGLNMEHGFIRRIEENQFNRQHQIKEDAVKRQETAKLARRVGMPNKSTKPTMEIYRPPSVRISGEFAPPSPALTSKSFTAPNSNGHNILSDYQALSLNDSGGGKPSGQNKVHFQLPQKQASSEPTKSALKRSKSFGYNNQIFDIASSSLEREHFPFEHQGLLKKALHDPNMLTCHQLMEVVRVVCNKATEGIQNAEPAAQLCLSIIEKEKGETFLESLLNSCREWYNERDKLLRPVGDAHSTSSIPRRWTAYVSFLTELFLRLKNRERHALQLSSSVSNISFQAPAAANRTLTLMMLLYECCQIILRPPSLNNAAEIECLRSVLTIVGQHLENDAPQRMEVLVSMMRDAFISPSISAQTRKTLLELIELRASGWHLDLQQSMYYFPYTSVDRK